MLAPPEIPDGMIALGSASADLLGFTPDKFDGYLWKKGSAVYVSFIISHSKGYFKALVDRIISLGLEVRIPTPLGRMLEIVVKNGYKHTVEKDPRVGACEVWVLGN